jgi:hypothetical protein
VGASSIASERDAFNASRFDPGDAGGFYESYFQRANHPTKPLAFWIRYTVFSPRQRPSDAVGQLWAVYFDGVTGRNVALKHSVPVRDCAFSSSGLQVTIGEATLDDRGLRGGIRSGGRTMSWDLTYAGDERPLLLMQRSSYERRFPSAKALCGTPFARFGGTLAVNEQTVSIDDWVGTQNHNWGTRHTDRYAWGQVAGFDDNPSAALECSTARLKLGPIWTPRLTLVVLRLDDRTVALNSYRQALRTHGEYGDFFWAIDGAAKDARVRIHMEAPRQSFVGLTYENPPGGVKTCLNTKLAGCHVVVEPARGKPVELSTDSRAAFEIVTDDGPHGVEMA